MFTLLLCNLSILGRPPVGNDVLSWKTPIRSGNCRPHTPIHSVHVLAAMLALGIFGAGPAQAQFIIDGTSLTVPPPLGNSPNADLIVGNSTTGALTVQNGGTVTDLRGFIAALSGSSGTVTVTGPGSTWTNNGQELLVGDFGTGTLTVQNGGRVSDVTGFIAGFSVSSGTVTVTDPGSTWANNGVLVVADAGTGTLTVQNGGTVTDTRGLIGNVSGSSGTVAVTGAGSTWTNSADLSVGGPGTGTLTIQTGGTVISSNGIIGGNGSSGTVMVAGPGSTWTDNGYLLVADGGTGTLTIQNGGTVSDTRGVIGNVSGSSGTVAVTGAGSTWTNSADLSVGGPGNRYTDHPERRHGVGCRWHGVGCRWRDRRSQRLLGHGDGDWPRLDLDKQWLSFGC